MPKLLSMINAVAEDNGLSKTVGGLEEFCDFGRNERHAPFQNQVFVVVGDVVLAVLDELAVFVALPGFGSPAVDILVEADADDFVGRKETVGYALPERVGVNRVAEVIDV